MCTLTNCYNETLVQLPPRSFNKSIISTSNSAVCFESQCPLLPKEQTTIQTFLIILDILYFYINIKYIYFLYLYCIYLFSVAPLLNKSYFVSFGHNVIQLEGSSMLCFAEFIDFYCYVLFYCMGLGFSLCIYLSIYFNLSVSYVASK